MAKTALRLRAAVAAVPSVICDGLGLVGAALVSYGGWLIYAPAGFITGGALLIVGSMLFGARLGPERS